MEISNDVLFMFAIILLFFCLMKDRPCNVEGLPDPAPAPAPASPNYNATVTFTPKRNLHDWLSQRGARDLNDWLSKHAKVDYSQCGPNGNGPCIPCSYIRGGFTEGCEGVPNQGPKFNINDTQNHYTYATGNNKKCNDRNCGIVCESQFEGGPDESVKYGLPQDQNGLFCKM